MIIANWFKVILSMVVFVTLLIAANTTWPVAYPLVMSTIGSVYIGWWFGDAVIKLFPPTN